MTGKTYDCIGRLFEDIMEIMCNNSEALQLRLLYNYDDDLRFICRIDEQDYEACRAEFNIVDNYINKNGIILTMDEALELLEKLKTIKETTITVYEKVIADNAPKYKITEVCEAIFRSGVNNQLQVENYLWITTKNGEEKTTILDMQMPYFPPEKYTAEEIKTKIENLLIFV